MKLVEAKVVVEFDRESAALIGHWAQWEMTGDGMSTEVYDALKELGSLLLPQSEQD